MNENIKTANKCILKVLLITLFLIAITAFFEPFFARLIVYTILTIYSLKTAKSKQISIPFKKPNVRNIVLCLVITVAALPIALVLNNIGIAISRNTSTNVNISEPLWVMIISMAILPAIGEEIAYRGLIQGAFYKESAFYSVLFSALAFSLIHVSVPAMMYAFLYGCIFALVRAYTNNLFYTIVMHICFNALNIGTFYISNISISPMIIFALTILGSMICIVSIKSLQRNSNICLADCEHSAREFISKEGVIAYVICLILTSVLQFV